MSVARLDFRNHRLASLLLAALFVVSMTNALRNAWDRFDELLHGGQYVRTSFDLSSGTFRVTELEPGAKQAGLQMGDLVIGVNGRPVQG